MRPRNDLMLLVLATALPLLAFALLASALLVWQEQDNYVTAVKDRNRAFMSAVDAQLKGTIGALEALGASGALHDGDLARFHAASQDVLAAHPGWLNLVVFNAEGRQVLNALAPWGDALHRPALESRSLRKAVQTHSPSVGNVMYGDGVFTSRPGIAVRVPIVREGKLVYVLSAIVKPESFQPLIEQQQVPAGWTSGLVDGEGQFIARVPAKPVGSPAGADYLAASRAAREGWYRGTTVEGLDTYTAHVRSDFSGWSVGFSIPAELVQRGPRRAAWLMAAGVALSLALAAAIALRLGRRLVPAQGAS